MQELFLRIAPISVNGLRGIRIVVQIHLHFGRHSGSTIRGVPHSAKDATAAPVAATAEALSVETAVSEEAALKAAAVAVVALVSAAVATAAPEAAAVAAAALEAAAVAAAAFSLQLKVGSLMPSKKAASAFPKPSPLRKLTNLHCFSPLFRGAAQWPETRWETSSRCLTMHRSLALPVQFSQIAFQSVPRQLPTWASPFT